MVDKTNKTPAITVTITQQQRDWLYERQRERGIPISRSVRDALDNTFPEIQREQEDQPEALAAAV